MFLLAAVLLGVRVGLLRLRSVLTGVVLTGVVLTGVVVTGAGDPSASAAAAVATAAATDGGGGGGGGGRGGRRLRLVVMAGTNGFGCIGGEGNTLWRL